MRGHPHTDTLFIIAQNAHFQRIPKKSGLTGEGAPSGLFSRTRPLYTRPRRALTRKWLALCGLCKIVLGHVHCKERANSPVSAGAGSLFVGTRTAVNPLRLLGHTLEEVDGVKANPFSHFHNLFLGHPLQMSYTLVSSLFNTFHRAT